MRGFPTVGRGQTVGLLGGSFDPAHLGHVHITREALKRFDLDWIWWLVSPGNPLKSHGPAPLAARLSAARTLMCHPKVRVTDIEARLGTRYTAETIAALQRCFPMVRFVWLMGADNLVQFHRWQDWRDIVGRVPVGVLARPGDRLPGRLATMPQIYPFARVSEVASQGLARIEPPCWCFVNIPMRRESSSAIRTDRVPSPGENSPGSGGQAGALGPMVRAADLR